MLCRVADALFWMNAYIERAENIARLIHVNMNLTLDLFLDAEDNRWMPLVIASGDNDDFTSRYQEFTEENVIFFLTFDPKNPNSILSCVHLARENARTVRDIISTELWEQVNNCYLMVQSFARKKNIENLNHFFKKIIMESHLFAGIAEATMLHNEGMMLGHIGRKLERADKTARFLDVKYFMLLSSSEEIDSPYDTLQWGALLKSISAFEMFKKKYKKFTSKNIVAFLLFDDSFPRSVSHCLKSSRDALVSMQDSLKGGEVVAVEAKELCAWFSKANVDIVMGKAMHQFIDETQLRLNDLVQTMTHSFFNYSMINSPEKSSTLRKRF